MFNNLQRGHLVNSVQRPKINQENEGIQLIHNKGIPLNQSRVPGSAKKVFGDVKNKLEIKSTTSFGGFPNNKNSPFPSASFKKTAQHDVLKPQKIQFHEDLFPKSSPFPTNSLKRTNPHEVLTPRGTLFEEDNEEFNLDLDTPFDMFPLPKAKREKYGYANNLFDLTNDEINDVLSQKYDEYQESPKLYNDDFNLRKMSMPASDLSFDEQIPLCMTPDWEIGNNSILDLFSNDDSCNSFASSNAEILEEEDELPDFFTFKFD